MCKKTAVLILAAQRKSGSLHHKYFKLSPCFLNIGTKLSIEIISNFYNYINDDVQIYVALNKHMDSIDKLKGFSNFQIVEVGNTNTILDTLKVALKHISESRIEVITSTTIPTHTDNSIESSIYISERLCYQEAWAGVQISADDVSFVSRDSSKAYLTKTHAFTGRLSTNKSCLEESLCYIESNNLPMNDLGILAEILYLYNDHTLTFCKWLDVGHDHTYLDTKRMSLTSRFFNNVKYIDEKNIIRKTSANTKKLLKEQKFYQSLSETNKNIFPRLHSQENSDTTPQSEVKIDLEYIPYPSLAEVFLYWNIGLNKWDKIISTLRSQYNSFYCNPNIKSFNCTTDHLYVNKFRKRTNDIRESIRNASPSFISLMLTDEFTVNKTLKFPSLLEQFESCIEKLDKLSPTTEMYVGHGDLCFNNILIDPIYSIVKLIDPRADILSETLPIGLVDPRYDIAKLSHSFLGLYDSIVNNLFSIKKNSSSNDYVINIVRPPDFDEIANIFLDKFSDVIPDNNNILVASLFYSMLPLHIDDLDRVAVLAAIGGMFLYNIPLAQLTFEL